MLERALNDTPPVWYEDVPKSGEGWENITEYRQNNKKITYLATKKLTVIY